MLQSMFLHILQISERLYLVCDLLLLLHLGLILFVTGDK